MKPIVQKLSSDARSSFVAKTFSTPHYEVGWHHHVECELILILEGNGISLVGDYMGNFEPGDVFFLGSGLPHTFKKGTGDMYASAMVVQFAEDFLGKSFFDLPETESLAQLLSDAKTGFRLKSMLAKNLASRLTSLEHLDGLQRLNSLLFILEELQDRDKLIALSSPIASPLSHRSKSRMDEIISFTVEHFREPITLELIAGRCEMTVPAFCLYFKKTAHKTYIRFLNEVRIRHACNRLTDSSKQVSEICFESGYNTLANFNRQFHKVTGNTPSAYRRTFNMLLK